MSKMHGYEGFLQFVGMDIGDLGTDIKVRLCFSNNNNLSLFSQYLSWDRSVSGHRPCTRSRSLGVSTQNRKAFNMTLVKSSRRCSPGTPSLSREGHRSGLVCREALLLLMLVLWWLLLLLLLMWSLLPLLRRLPTSNE